LDFSERQLLKRAAQGDSDAFGLLVKPHLAAVRRYAFSFSRDWTEADDLAQEALIKAFRSIKTFEARSSLSTWLYTVTRSVCHDHVRSRYVKERRRQDELEDDELEDDERGALELVVEKESAERLWEALKKLEPEFRVPVVLFDIEGMSYEDIARIEQVPIGTVRSRLSRGRQRLARALGELGHAERVPSGTLSLESSSTRRKAAP
jgi:RNA polymerase sigma-70 factor (ECF subfamily)